MLTGVLVRVSSVIRHLLCLVAAHLFFKYLEKIIIVCGLMYSDFAWPCCDPTTVGYDHSGLGQLIGCRWSALGRFKV